MPHRFPRPTPCLVRRNPSPPRQSGPHPRPRDKSQRSVQNRIMPASTLINPVKKSGYKNSTSSGPCSTRLSGQKMAPFARIFQLHANDPARTPLFSMKSTTGPIRVAQRQCSVAALDVHSLRWPARRLKNEPGQSHLLLEERGRAMRPDILGVDLRFFSGSANCAWGTEYLGVATQWRTCAGWRSYAARGLCGHGSCPLET